MINSLYTPLYIVTNNVKEELETTYPLHELYIFLLRDQYQDNLHVLSTVRDLWCYFYFEEKELVLHPEINLIYSLRSMIVKITSSEESLGRLKNTTINLASESMLAAIECMNRCIDVLDTFHQSFEQEMQDKLNTFIAFDISKLFNQQFNLIEEYPSKFVEIQAAAIKALRLFAVHENEQFKEDLKDISKSVRDYHLQHKKFFNFSD